MGRRGIRLAVVTCIAVATLSNAGATGTENAGRAYMSGLRYDRYTNATGAAVNWELTGPTPPSEPPSIWLYDIGDTTSDTPAGNLTTFGGTFQIELARGHGVTGTLGRSDRGTIDLNGVWYGGPGFVAFYYCAGTYERRELIFSIVEDCTPFRYFVGTPPFTNPHLEAKLVLTPAEFRKTPPPVHPTQYKASYGVFTVS
jgi:hypothetical protein